MNDKEIMDARKHCAEWPEKILLGTRYWGKDARLPPRYFGAKNTVEIHDASKGIVYIRADVVAAHDQKIIDQLSYAFDHISINAALVITLRDAINTIKARNAV